ncbi:hypothetical protein CR513_39698, partial [Mucuna pruriens]
MVNLDGLSKAQFVKKLHKKARAHMEKKSEQYAKHANKRKKGKVFEEGIQGSNLKKNSFQEGEPDMNLGRHEKHGENTKHSEVKALQGPMIRKRLKRLEKE